MQEIVLQILKEDYQKALKKVFFLFFFSNPVHLKGQSYQKQKGSGTSASCSSGYKTSKKKSDQV